jgi:hypothetical protein
VVVVGVAVAKRSRVEGFGQKLLEGWATAAHGRNESCSSVYVMYLNFNGHIELWPISPNRGTLIIEMLVVRERIN